MDTAASIKRSKKVEILIKFILGACAAVSVLTTLGVVFVLTKESIPFFKQVPITDFLFGTHWAPLLEPKSFGVLPLVMGTLQIVIGSALVSIPLGLITSIYLSEYASFKTRSIIKPLLEILAGIPTIVYGFFALSFITPILKTLLPQIEIFNALSASIVVGIMIFPMITSLCDDAFQAVDKELKMGGYALGATSMEVIGQIILPASLSRVLAAFLLAISRAVGETMAVTLAAGAHPSMSFNPLKSVQTMTSYIVQVSLGDTQMGGIEYMTCFAVGLLLFVITLSMNIIGQKILFRYRGK